MTTAIVILVDGEMKSKAILQDGKVKVRRATLGRTIDHEFTGYTADDLVAGATSSWVISDQARIKAHLDDFPKGRTSKSTFDLSAKAQTTKASFTDLWEEMDEDAQNAFMVAKIEERKTAQAEIEARASK